MERFQELNEAEKTKTEAELERWTMEERRARNAGRIFAQAYSENKKKENEGELKKYKQGIFNFEFGTIMKGVAALREPPIRKTMLEFLKKVTFDYFGVQYEKKNAELVDVEREIDKKIPFQKEALFTYLSFVPYWIGAIGFIKKEFGEKGAEDVSKLLTDMAGFYAESGMIFRKAQTTMKRGGVGGIAYKILHAIDKPLNLFPSLHGEVAAHTYSRTVDTIDGRADNPSDYALVKDRMLNRASGILESCLLTKQHAVVDIGGSLAMVSARDPHFTEERAGILINNMFQKLPVGMTEETAAEVRREIITIYTELIQKISEEPGRDYTKVLVGYIADLDEKSV